MIARLVACAACAACAAPPPTPTAPPAPPVWVPLDARAASLLVSDDSLLQLGPDAILSREDAAIWIAASAHRWLVGPVGGEYVIALPTAGRTVDERACVYLPADPMRARQWATSHTRPAGSAPARWCRDTPPVVLGQRPR